MINTTTCICYAGLKRSILKSYTSYEALLTMLWILTNSDWTSKFAVPEASSKKFRFGPTLGAVAGVVFLLVLLLLYLWWRSRRQAAAKQLDLRSRFQPDYFQIEKARSNKVASTRTWEVPTGIHHFTIEDLVKATGGFDRSNEIGEGCFGKVYVGRFPDGRTLAIKRGGPAKYSSEESDRGQFRNEVLALITSLSECFFYMKLAERL